MHVIVCLYYDVAVFIHKVTKGTKSHLEVVKVECYKCDMDFCLLTAIAVVIVLALIYWFGVKDYAVLSDIPINGPKPWPYLGNVPDIILDGGFHKTLWKNFKRFGRVHKFYVGRRPGFVVTDPEMIKIILVKEFDKFRNRPRFIKFNPPLSYVLPATQDDAWKRIRTIMTPTFSAAKLRQINPIVEDCLETLQKKMQDYSATGR